MARTPEKTIFILKNILHHNPKPDSQNSLHCGLKFHQTDRLRVALPAVLNPLVKLAFYSSLLIFNLKSNATAHKD